jgi:hypothetical protein
LFGERAAVELVRPDRDAASTAVTPLGIGKHDGAGATQFITPA